jgi:uncharacterized iron-regulated membrane protein
MKFRTIVFWFHLCCGVTAGTVILIMSVTGVLLTYQRQITAWADTRGYHIEPVGPRLDAEALVAKVAHSRPDLAATAVVIRSDLAAPVSFTVGPGRQLFVDPYTGAIFGEGNGHVVRAFFRRVVEWHRYIGAAGASRPIGRAITGASNLIFLFIVISGLFLWWPRSWKWSTIGNITSFKGGLHSKARDFNWHNTIGFWSAIPLAIVVFGGTVISYPWATGLVYRVYGEAPPAAGGVAARAAEPRNSDRPRPTRARAERVPIAAIIESANAHMPNWKTITVPLSTPTGPRIVLTVDSGDGGQPQKRGTLTLDGSTAAALRWEPFASQSSGRKARTWLRFAHTGEIYGIPGQTLAGIVTAGGAMLVWTGLALALRRFLGWRKRSRFALPRAA